MTNLLTAICDAIKANPAFNIFPNGPEAIEGENDEVLPNLLIIQTGEPTDYNTGPTCVANCFIQFTIRSTDGTQVAGAMEAIRKQFHRKPLIIQDEVLMDCTLSGGINRVIKEDERVYRGDVEYKFTVSKAV